LIRNEEAWSVDYFKQSLTQLHPKLITNQCAMEKFILLLFGLNLHKRDDGNDLDFKYTLNFLNKSIEILKGLFKTDANTYSTACRSQSITSLSHDNEDIQFAKLFYLLS